MQLRVENLLLARHYVALEQLLLNVLEAEARYRLREALSGLALLAEEQDGLLYRIEGLFFVGNIFESGRPVTVDLPQRPPMYIL